MGDEELVGCEDGLDELVAQSAGLEETNRRIEAHGVGLSPELAGEGGLRQVLVRSDAPPAAATAANAYREVF